MVTKTKKKTAIKPLRLANPNAKSRKRINLSRPTHLYALLAVIILAATTTLWAILGANLQQNNADQLSDPYLFESSSTLHNAQLPGAHSFLIKWPLFFLIKLLGYTPTSFIAITTVTVLATVAILVFILYRIERRPVFFGTLCLALASVLLMVPAQPYAGGLLPVNMAMLATRNLEYALYIGALILFINSRRIQHWRFWLAFLTLGILAASDKLFLIMSLGGSLLALVVYSFRHKWEAANLSSTWLVNSLAAGLTSIILLGLIGLSGFTNISSSSSGVPYTLIHSAKDLALGIFYGVSGLITNFGANPAYDATIVHNVPHQFFARLFSLDGPAYVVNFIIFAACILAGYRVLRASFSEKNDLISDRPSALSLTLIWSAIAAAIIFVVSSHYYAVDARYLTIALFALFVSVATGFRSSKWPEKNLMIISVIIGVGICFGIVSSIRTYSNQQFALSSAKERNALVIQALKSHPVNTLVGDYWRVLPARLASDNKLKVMPLQDCTTPRDLLSSKAWQTDLKTHSFAYLLSLDGSLSDFTHCSLAQVLDKYGRPNSSVLIAGALSKPKELLLLYDHGINMVTPKTGRPNTTPTTILPVNLGDLTSTSCPVPTVMNIVAHQDDDLLFMNPDIENDIAKGYCVRTVYLTAGDDGSDKYYWLEREQGSEAAYSYMTHSSNIWIQRIIKLSDHEYITIANPKDNSKVSLIFMHLPDGNIFGQGFASSHFGSLAKLDSGRVSSLTAVDKQSYYSQVGLIQAITSLMYTYNPTEIRTQANFVSKLYTDHSDHMAVGRFVKNAYQVYEQQQFQDQVSIPLKFYIGYPIHARPENVFGTDLDTKEAAFFKYAQFDNAVCTNMEQCNRTSAYGFYLTRQYQDQE